MATAMSRLPPSIALGATLTVPLFGGAEQKRRRAQRSHTGYYCDVWTVLSSVAIIVAYARCQLQVESPDADDPTTAEVSDAARYQCGLAALVLGTAVTLEAFNVVAHFVSKAPVGGTAQQHLEAAKNKPGAKTASSLWTLFGWHDSVCMLMVYMIFFIVNIGMYFDRGHRFEVSDPFLVGTHRPVNILRYAEWSLSSPTLMSLVGRSIPRRSNKSEKDTAEMLRPAFVLTVVYIIAAWIALVVTNFIWRWALIGISFVGYVLTSYDQWTTWRQDVDQAATTATATVKFLAAQIGVFLLYGVIYLLGTTGIVSPVTEMAMLTFADCTIKIACSAMLTALRHADALAEARRARGESAMVADDLSRLINTANAPIFAVDGTMRLTLWNRKLTALTGATEQEVIGKPIADILSEDCLEDVQPILDARMRDKAGEDQFHCSFMAEMKKTNGKARANGHHRRREASLIMAATARHDAFGHVVGVVGVGQDLTEVTRYRAVEQKKNQFMAVVSHELKSPLHGIIGLSEMLSQTEPVVHRKEKLQMVRSCATRLLDLVSNIMEMSRLKREQKNEDGSSDDDLSTTSSRTPLSKDPVDVPSIVEEVCVLVRNATDKGGRPLLLPMVQLENEISPGAKGRLPIVEGDAYKLTQVFYNLITNACKFCQVGKITISARVSESNKLLVLISDTGIGISPEAEKRIFEPFEQESDTEKRSFGGIGLGLAISREVVRMHGGNITVQSTLGEGSTFIVALPVTPDAVASAMAERDEANAGKDEKEPNEEVQVVPSSPLIPSPQMAMTLASTENEKPVILSVDDDFVNQEVIKAALSDKYEIHVAMNGFEAMEYFSANSKLPDLVLLDVMMPGMDGFEVLKCIREEKHISPAALPVIMVSAIEPVDKAIVRSLAAGSNDYVTKPFDPDILRARVQTSLQIRRLYQVETESYHTRRLLNEILPSHIIQRLILGDQAISERHDSVCMLFSDIVGWTPMAEKVPTSQLIRLLNELFSTYDELTEKYGVFKAETIGDAYIVAAGHDGNCTDHTSRVVEFGLAMLEATKSVTPPSGMQLQIRVGIHTGPVYTGVVGTKVPKYSFFGDTVNMAARMETTGVPGCLNLSPAAVKALSNQTLVSRGDSSIEEWFQTREAKLADRDNVEVKGKGVMRTYLVCPKGVSFTAATKLSLARRASFGSLENGLPKTESTVGINADVENRLVNAEEKAAAAIADARASSRMEAKIRAELEALKNEQEKTKASERAAWHEVERLKESLVEAKVKLHEDRKIVGSNSTKVKKMRRNSSRGSLSTTADLSDVSEEDIVTSSDVEELRLQLLVTTKSLMRARRIIMEKEEEMDEKELELQRILALGGKKDRGHVGNDGIHSVRRRSDFMLRTQGMLNSSFSSLDRESLLEPTTLDRRKSEPVSISVEGGKMQKRRSSRSLIESDDNLLDG